MHERKQRFFKGTHAVVALPGGIGTLEETTEAITWNSLDLHNYPVFLLNTKGFYKPFRALLKHQLDHGFMKQSDFDIFTLVDRSDQILDAICRTIQ